MNHCFCKTKTNAIYFGQSQRKEISSTNQRLKEMYAAEAKRGKTLA